MQKLKIIDLFSGAGGLTFGFNYKLTDQGFVLRDEYEHIFANEFDVNAVKAFRMNYPNSNTVVVDISLKSDVPFEKVPIIPILKKMLLKANK